MNRKEIVENRKQNAQRRESLFSTFYPLPSVVSSRGFTILFAVLISSVMLAIGIAIFNITVRELRLSSIVRDSARAVYAADSGAECGIYNIFKLGLYSTSSVNAWTCNGQTLSNIGGIGYATSTIPRMTYSDGTCADLYVARSLVSASTGQERTIIESHGYNPCDAASPSRVERVYRIVF